MKSTSEWKQSIYIPLGIENTGEKIKLQNTFTLVQDKN